MGKITKTNSPRIIYFVEREYRGMFANYKYVQEKILRIFFHYSTHHIQTQSHTIVPNDDV